MIDEKTEALEQVTTETARCKACDKRIDFERTVPYVPQPDDVDPGHMKVAAASIVMSSGVDGIVCDAACLDAFEKATGTNQNRTEET